MADFVGSLCCDTADEAKTLIPSLAPKMDDESLQPVLDELQKYRMPTPSRSCNVAVADFFIRGSLDHVSYPPTHCEAHPQTSSRNEIAVRKQMIRDRIVRTMTPGFASDSNSDSLRRRKCMVRSLGFAIPTDRLALLGQCSKYLYFSKSQAAVHRQKLRTLITLLPTLGGEIHCPHF
jgi:hypothetical protein